MSQSPTNTAPYPSCKTKPSLYYAYFQTANAARRYIQAYPAVSVLIYKSRGFSCPARMILLVEKGWGDITNTPSTGENFYEVTDTELAII